MPNTLSNLMAAYHGIPSRNDQNSRSVAYYTRPRIQVTSTEGTGHLYAVARLPAHARIIAQWVANGTIAGMTDNDLGIYPSVNWSLADPVAHAPTALFEALDLTVVRQDVLLTVTATGLLWEAAGMTAAPRPGTTLDIAMLTNTDPGATSFFHLGFLYAVGP
jgi:hypothetical protein